MTMRDYKLRIAVNTGHEQTVYDTGFIEATEAIQRANEIIDKKFGSKDQLELTRRHKRRRE